MNVCLYVSVRFSLVSLRHLSKPSPFVAHQRRHHSARGPRAIYTDVNVYVYICIDRNRDSTSSKSSSTWTNIYTDTGKIQRNKE